MISISILWSIYFIFSISILCIMEMSDENANQNHNVNVQTNDNIAKEEPREREIVTIDEPEEGEILSGTNVNSTKTNSREVLVQLGLNRNKVFHITDNNTLSKLFETFIAEDASFSKLSRKSHLILQICNPKFKTWVELDNEDELKDGSVVKALFFPADFCTGVKNSENPKRKRKISPFGSRRNNDDGKGGGDDDNDGSVSSDNSQHIQECHERETIYEPLVKRRSALQDQIARCGGRPDPEEPSNSIQLCCRSDTCRVLEPVLCDEIVLNLPNTPTLPRPLIDIRFDNETLFVEKREWARYYSAMPASFWRNVIFSHSTYFELKNNYIYCLNKCPSDIKDRCTVKSFWCAMTHHGPHIIVPMESSLNSNTLFKILHDGVIPLSLKLQSQTKGSLVLQYSYELQTQFLGKKIVNYLEKNPIKLLEWPMFVSNINPMSAFWTALEEKMRGVRVLSVNGMTKAIIETCLYDPEIKMICKYLVESVPRLIKYIVDGGNISRMRVW